MERAFFSVEQDWFIRIPKDLTLNFSKAAEVEKTSDSFCAGPHSYVRTERSFVVTSPIKRVSIAVRASGKLGNLSTASDREVRALAPPFVHAVPGKHLGWTYSLLPVTAEASGVFFLQSIFIPSTMPKDRSIVRSTG